MGYDTYDVWDWFDNRGFGCGSVEHLDVHVHRVTAIPDEDDEAFIVENADGKIVAVLDENDKGELVTRFRFDDDGPSFHEMEMCIRAGDWSGSRPDPHTIELQRLVNEGGVYVPDDVDEVWKITSAVLAGIKSTDALVHYVVGGREYNEWLPVYKIGAYAYVSIAHIT